MSKKYIDCGTMKYLDPESMAKNESAGIPYCSGAWRITEGTLYTGFVWNSELGYFECDGKDNAIMKYNETDSAYEIYDLDISNTEPENISERATKTDTEIRFETEEMGTSIYAWSR